MTTEPRSAAKRRLFRVLSGLCWMIAAAAVGLGTYLVNLGANPPDGHGSLGHVGMIIAGGVSGFVALTLGLLGVYCYQRAARLDH